jgi:hypothetical protein
MYMDDENRIDEGADGELGKSDGGIALQSQGATSLSGERQTSWPNKGQDQFVVSRQRALRRGLFCLLADVKTTRNFEHNPGKGCNDDDDFATRTTMTRKGKGGDGGDEKGMFSKRRESGEGEEEGGGVFLCKMDERKDGERRSTSSGVKVVRCAERERALLDFGGVE